MKRDIDFYRAYLLEHKMEERQGRAGSGYKAVLLCVLINIGAAALVTGAFVFQGSRVNEKLRALDAQVNDPERLAQYEHIVETQARYSEMLQYNGMVESAHATVTSEPQLGLAHYTLLTGSMLKGMELVKFQLSEAEVTVTFIAAKNADAPDYAEIIKDSGVFEDVTYEGWWDEQAEEGSQFKFTAHCILKQEVAGE